MTIPRDFRSRCEAALAVVSVFLVVMACAAPVSAQTCIEGLSTSLFDTSNNCSAQPEIDRVFGTQIVNFDGTSHLVVNVGNELKIWNINNPYDPKVRDESFFNMGNVGDSDYDLLNFTVCENCRFGLAAFKRGTVVFDLGTGSTPDFDTKEKYMEATTVPGGLVFRHGTKEYLIATDLPDECSTGSTLYEITGVTANGLNRIGCVSAPDVTSTGIVGGDYYDGYVYAVDRSTRVFLYKVESYGSAITLTYIDTPMIAQISQGSGFGLDEERGVAVTASSDGLNIYDLSTPGMPLKKSTAAGFFTRAAVRGTLAYAGRQGSLSYDMTFDISDLSRPQQVDPDFWDRDNPFHNPTDSDCVSLRSAVFSPDSNVLYLARYSKLQMVDMAACGGGVAPVAGISVSPSSVFPGDSVTIREDSPGSPQQWMIWVTSTEDPHSPSGFVTGQTAFSAQNATSVIFTVDRDVLASEQFWAHVAVQSEDFPYSYTGDTPDQIATRAIVIDRAPKILGLSFDPSAPITGDPEVTDPVQFTPEVEGHPFSATQEPTYQWNIKSPQGEPMSFEGSPIDVELDESGTWAITLTVHYEHEAEDAVVGTDLIDYYSDTYTDTLNISSVSASFTYSPSKPLNTENLTFTSTSNVADSATPSYQWTIDGPTAFNCPSGPNASSCQIPAETLDDGYYDVTLRVTNTVNDDWSEKTIDNIHVADGHIQLDFTWSPTDPEIGDTITFNMTGVSDVVDSAVWSFGGGTCTGSGFTNPYNCDPDTDYFECKTTGYQYSSGGTKTVSLTIWVAGQKHGPVEHDIVVASTGSCDGGGGGGGGGGGCSYTVTPTSANFGGTGGSGQVSVDTSSGCSWTASTNYSWLQITSGSSGTNDGTVRYNVADNAGGAARSGYLTVAGKSVRIDQAAGACSYTLSALQSKFDAAGGTGTVTVNTVSGCSWTAVPEAGWITITSGASASGSGVVNYAVAANPWGNERSGTVRIAQNTFTVVQGPLVPTDFAISEPQPDIGQTVTFVVPSGVTPVRWHFGDVNCAGDTPVVECSSLSPGACYNMEWSWQEAGLVSVYLETTTGEKTKTVWVQNEGECPIPCLADTRPNASFTMSPNPAMVGDEVSFTDTSGDASKAQALGFTFDPGNPEIGETVEFDITGIGSVDWARWNFGEPGCSGFPQEYTCTPIYTDCLKYGHKFASAGEKQVTLTVQVSGSSMGPVNKTLTVQNVGSCSGGGGGTCTYTISPTNAAYAAEGGGGLINVTTQAGCTWTSQSNATWVTITSGASGTSSGSVGYSVAQNLGTARSTTIQVAGKTFTISQQGTGGSGCTYTISPTSANYTDDGGSGVISVTTQTGCEWTAQSTVNWATINSGVSGSGNGAVAYTVAANSGPQRAGLIQVAGKTFTINQDAFSGGELNSDPTEWYWELVLDGEVLVTSTVQNPKYVFTKPGLYEVRLTAGNCRGTDTAVNYLQVDPPPIPEPEDFIVPAAVHAPGLNGTLWKTDLRLFNPGNDTVKVNIEYLPEGVNNAAGILFGLDFLLTANSTRIFEDIVDAIPGIQGDANKGSLRITFIDDQGGQPFVKPLIMSRTYNDTLSGTFGQFVPAVPVLPNEEGKLYLTGLVEDLYYRTNVGLANFGSEDAWVLLTVLDKDGNEIGQVGKTVPGFSTYQVTQVAAAVGIQTALNIFSVEVNTYDADMSVYASVVDNVTGDPVLYSAYSLKDEVVYVPGIAHLPGLNDSVWRSDMSFFNPTGSQLEVHVEYIPAEEDISDRPYMNFTGMGPGKAYLFTDVLDSLMSQDSKGYMIVKGLNGSLVPQIAARTYSKDDTAGTFGQNLKVFCAQDLLDEGETGFIAGVTNSTSAEVGFRTNMGLLNTNQAEWTEVAILIFDGNGETIGAQPSLYLKPGEFQQFNLFQRLGIGGVDIDAASVKIEVLTNGPVAAYASEVDNATQDPVLIPAQMVVME